MQELRTTRKSKGTCPDHAKSKRSVPNAAVLRASWRVSALLSCSYQGGVALPSTLASSWQTPSQHITAKTTARQFTGTSQNKYTMKTYKNYP